MVFEKLCPIIAEQFGVDESEIDLETSFVDDLNATSIDIVDLMLAVESTFDMDEIEESDLENVKTVGDVVNYITSKI
ncbi:MAG: acyl carrier protein [Ruminococcaceae bacterium]|jgi:acyl carrier protein|nr:acyl carrier protein [Oscillospiraceae bacterium]